MKVESLCDSVDVLVVVGFTAVGEDGGRRAGLMEGVRWKAEDAS